MFIIDMREIISIDYYDIEDIKKRVYKMKIVADMKMCNHLLWMCEVCNSEAGRRTETEAIAGVVLEYGLHNK